MEPAHSGCSSLCILPLGLSRHAKGFQVQESLSLYLTVYGITVCATNLSQNQWYARPVLLQTPSSTSWVLDWKLCITTLYIQSTLLCSNLWVSGVGVPRLASLDGCLSLQVYGIGKAREQLDGSWIIFLPKSSSKLFVSGSISLSQHEIGKDLNFYVESRGPGMLDTHVWKSTEP